MAIDIILVEMGVEAILMRPLTWARTKSDVGHVHPPCPTVMEKRSTIALHVCAGHRPQKLNFGK